MRALLTRVCQSGGISGKEPPANAGDMRHGLHPWVGKIPWRKAWQPPRPPTSILALRISMNRGELYAKALRDPDNPDGVVTHLESDMLECEVNWALGSISMSKAGDSDGFSAERFKTLKNDAANVLRSVCQQIWKTQQWPQDWKCPFSFQSQRQATPKNAQITAQLHSFHMPEKYAQNPAS